MSIFPAEIEKVCTEPGCSTRWRGKVQTGELGISLRKASVGKPATNSMRLPACH